jgi:transketolase
MRKSFQKTVSKALGDDENFFLLLGDIGVYSFREEFLRFPNRVLNVGIMEQSMVGFASGLSIEGKIPIVHTIAPFLVERALEQLKIDFGYQKLDGYFFSIGASYDYTKLGPTHHSPADVNILTNIPNMVIIVPGTGDELEELFEESKKIHLPKYFRMSDVENRQSIKSLIGKAAPIKSCASSLLIIVVGNSMRIIEEHLEEIPHNILYFTSIIPFDSDSINKINPKKILVVEPYYSGAISTQLLMINKSYIVRNFGVPVSFVDKYGTLEEIENYLGYTWPKLKSAITEFIND